ncbi:TIGR01777 family protein [Corallococcus sp. H22C18031201]|uniref:TIGR01777 family oxidoreductase n=1 Tax=Citreicoccus inhibens TaxID=2849499 RepID=UPI000E73F2D6|nr:TIGR01777 family oxidoreductase [Citreicoccus inhibens]MBU8898766.1 TIGR01777 family oxidoreductase [Citreicoccus inhibens]RJS24139.1 TIGR01777 family protein [Corallococcus sp. H22C18031201]
MRVAVTGASGFLGARLVQCLCDVGHQVHVLSRNLERTLASLPAGVTGTSWVGWEVPDGALAGVEAVVHLAGEPVDQRWTREVKHRIHDSRVLGTRAVVAALERAGTVRRFVSASAVGYYGGARGAQPLTESHAPGDDFLARVCQDWETEALRARAAGVATAVLRIGVVLHPSGGALHRMLPLFRVGAGGRVGAGLQYVSWVHREDLVDLLRFVVERPELEGALNATSPVPVTNAEFAHALGRVLERPAGMHVPGLVLKARFGEMARVVLEGQRVLPARALERGFVFQHPELEAALRDLLGPAALA